MSTQGNLVQADTAVIGAWGSSPECLYLATGFSSHGLKLAPSVGEIVADTDLGNLPDLDVSPFRLERFEQGESMFCTYGPGARS
ncbi:hypothetical protein N9K16_01045 [Alphaproteobacteria bacterium]|nr:hypothetical protein [Alphaproteobacteria bacterium]